MFYDLRPYQLLAIQKIARDKRVIVADDMGLGKTAEAIAAKHLIDREVGERPAFVVCPSGVMPHWKNEVREWYWKGEGTKVAFLSVKDFYRDLKIAEGADFVIAPYSLLSHLPDDPNRVQKILEQRFSYGILDEGQNAKNPKSLRASSAREIFHQIPHLAILSGTPMPNSVLDIYSLLNLLEPKSFPIDKDSAGEVIMRFYEILREKPHLVRDVLHARMIRRTAETYLNGKMPVLEQTVRECTLTGLHEQVYLALYENDEIPPAQKLQELVKAAIDPGLVSPRFLPPELREQLHSARSDTLGVLEEIVRKEAALGGKVLGFTDLKRGIVNGLLKRFRNYGAVAITGDTPGEFTSEGNSEREKLRRRFQTDPETKVLFMTDVGNEGIDATAATAVIHITVPYTGAEIDQRNRRSQRASAEVEKGSMKAFILKPVLSSGAPTITEGVLQLVVDKKMIIDAILDAPGSLTLDDLFRAQNGHPEAHPSVAQFLSPRNFMDYHLGSLKGMGGIAIEKEYYEKPWMAQNLAIAYARYWEGFYGGNAATLTAQIIRRLAGNIRGEEMLDIACGPFSLSRRMQIPMTGLDLNPYMLEAGKILERERKIPEGNTGIEGLAHNLPFEPSRFRFANCSLALHMSTLNELNDSGMPEREVIFREANRVLPTGGFYVFTLPYSVIHRSDVPTFSQGLQQLGFDVLPETGFYTSPEGSQARFRVFLGALQKRECHSPKPLAEGSLAWKMDERFGHGRKGVTKNRRKRLARKKRKEPYQIITEFVKEDTGRVLEAEHE